MSKFQELKRELSILEKTFGPRHEHFRVEANGLDEVTYRFLASNGEHVVHCNIYVSQVWFLVGVDEPITILITKNISKCSNFNVPLVKQESYPNPPPMWFAESEDAKITQIVEFLSCIEPNAPNLVRWFCFPFTFTLLSPEILERSALCNQRFLFLAAPSLHKTLGQGTIQLAEYPCTITHRQLRSCSAYTRKFT